MKLYYQVPLARDFHFLPYIISKYTIIILCLLKISLVRSVWTGAKTAPVYIGDAEFPKNDPYQFSEVSMPNGNDMVIYRKLTNKGLYGQTKPYFWYKIYSGTDLLSTTSVHHNEFESEFSNEGGSSICKIGDNDNVVIFYSSNTEPPLETDSESRIHVKFVNTSTGVIQNRVTILQKANTNIHYPGCVYSKQQNKIMLVWSQQDKSTSVMQVRYGFFDIGVNTVTISDGFGPDGILLFDNSFKPIICMYISNSFIAGGISGMNYIVQRINNKGQIMQGNKTTLIQTQLPSYISCSVDNAMGTIIDTKNVDEGNTVFLDHNLVVKKTYTYGPYELVGLNSILHDFQVYRLVSSKNTFFGLNGFCGQHSSYDTSSIFTDSADEVFHPNTSYSYKLTTTKMSDGFNYLSLYYTLHDDNKLYRIQSKLNCPYNCLTCNGPNINNCLTCPATTNRVMILADPRFCLCLPGYYEDYPNVLCQPCHPQCSNCFSTAQNHCLECFSTQNREILGNDCVCKIGYGENGTLLCTPIICEAKCATCFGQTSNCATCSANRVNPPACTCQPGYQENNGVCVQIQCPAFATLQIDFTCKCNEGYILKTNLSSVQFCEQCNVKCKNCDQIDVNSCNVCIDSDPPRVLPKCGCPQGYEENQQSQCIIIDQGPTTNKPKEKKPKSTLIGTITKYITYIVIIFIIPLAMSGNMYLILSIIDFTQILNYIMYINVMHPEFFLIFLEGLNSINFPFLFNFFKIFTSFEEDYLLQKSPSKFRYERYVENDNSFSAFFFENSGGCFTFLIIPTLGYCLIKIIYFLLSRIEKKYPNKIVQKLRYLIDNQLVRMEWNMFIEIMFMDYLKFMVSGFMQFNALSQKSSLDKANYSIWGISLVFLLIYPFLQLYRTRKYTSSRNEKFRERYENSWNGLDYSRKESIVFNFYLLFRKLLFSVMLIFLHDYTYTQMTLMSFINVCLLLIMIKIKPFIDKKYLFVNCMTEVMFITLQIFIMFDCNAEKCNGDGQFQVYLCFTVICMHLSLVVYNILVLLYQWFQKIRNKQNREKNQRRKPLDQASLGVDKIQQLIEIQQKTSKDETEKHQIKKLKQPTTSSGGGKTLNPTQYKTNITNNSSSDSEISQQGPYEDIHSQTQKGSDEVMHHDEYSVENEQKERGQKKRTTITIKNDNIIELDDSQNIITDRFERNIVFSPASSSIMNFDQVQPGSQQLISAFSQYSAKKTPRKRKQRMLHKQSSSLLETPQPTALTLKPGGIYEPAFIYSSEMLNNTYKRSYQDLVSKGNSMCQYINENSKHILDNDNSFQSGMLSRQEIPGNQYTIPLESPLPRGNKKVFPDEDKMISCAKSSAGQSLQFQFNENWQEGLVPLEQGMERAQVQNKLNTIKNLQQKSLNMQHNQTQSQHNLQDEGLRSRSIAPGYNDGILIKESYFAQSHRDREIETSGIISPLDSERQSRDNLNLLLSPSPRVYSQQNIGQVRSRTRLRKSKSKKNI